VTSVTRPSTSSVSSRSLSYSATRAVRAGFMAQFQETDSGAKGARSHAAHMSSLASRQGQGRGRGRGQGWEQELGRGRGQSSPSRRTNQSSGVGGTVDAGRAAHQVLSTFLSRDQKGAE
jgi:hypothetical protein